MTGPTMVRVGIRISNECVSVCYGVLLYTYVDLKVEISRDHLCTGYMVHELLVITQER